MTTPNTPDPARIVARMEHTAGEVRFVKDRGDDSSGWAWNSHPPTERKIAPDYAFDPKKTKVLARVLRSTMMSLGHCMSGYSLFAKLKSADISPDGALGGRGYIQAIKDMRRAYMNVIEALSAAADTLYDEIHAPHWAVVSRQEDEEDRKEIEQVLQEVDVIKNDPEAWAEEEEEEAEKEILGDNLSPEDEEGEYDLDEEEEEEEEKLPPWEDRLEARLSKKGAVPPSKGKFDFFLKLLREALENIEFINGIARSKGIHRIPFADNTRGYLQKAVGILEGKGVESTFKDQGKIAAFKRLQEALNWARRVTDNPSAPDFPEFYSWYQIQGNISMVLQYMAKDL